MIPIGRLATLMQIQGEGGSDWLIVSILVGLTVLAMVWLFQRFRPYVRRRRADGTDMEREREERHTTGGPTRGAFGRRWNPRS